MSQLRPLLTCMLLGACAVSACFSCSVINKYDDVVPTKSANGGTSAGGNHAGGNHAGGLDEMAGEGDVPNTGGTSTGGANGGSGGVGVPTHGLLAVAGTDPTKLDGSVVSLIDPTTGTELARQTITGGAAVAGLAYDGATGKDVWYEFTAGSFPADPTLPASLQVYRFTDAGAAWKVISSKALGGLPPPRPHSFVVLNDRLAYLSYTIVGMAAVDSLTVLDTTDPTAVKPLKLTLTLPAGVEVLGMVGTRGVLGDETAPGGTLAVLIGNSCTGKHLLRVCGKIQLLPVTVSDDASAGVAVDLSQTLIGEPGFTSAQSTQLGYVAFTPGLNKTESLKYFDPRKLATISSGAPPYAAHWLGGLAYAECQDVGLFTAVADKTLYSSSSSGLSDDAPLPHTGQSLVYEPFTGHIITLFNPDNAEFADAPAAASGDGGAGGSDGGMPELDSFDVTSSAVLSRTAVAKWNPPKNLAPNIAVARFPLSYVCK
jgi:hypothetical protein